MNDECGCGIGAGSRQVVRRLLKSAAGDGGRGKSGFPINGGAARPEHFSRSAAQREMGFHAVGV